MSKVYEAITKAKREGRWSGEIQPSQTEESAAAARNATITGIVESPRPRQDPEPAATIEFQPSPSPEDSIEAPRIRMPRPEGLLHRLWRHGARPLAGRGPALTLGRDALRAGNEQFQVLRAGLQEWVAEHHKRVILVTSALRGEGKSFVAVNLAANLAKPGSPVLLVDCDFREPSLHRALNLLPLRSLRDYLVGEASFSECLTPTPIPGLTLVAARGDNFPAAEAFAGPRMREFMASARELEPAHYVLIDAPATLAAPEAQILASLVDAALLVVKANYTPREMVTEGHDTLKGMPIIGAVLNYFEPSYSSARHLNYYPYRKMEEEDANLAE